MGTEEKVVFRFSERILARVGLGDHPRSGGLGLPGVVRFQPHVGAPSLVAIYNPHFNLAWRDARRGSIEVALDVLRKMFGSVPDPDEALATDWAGIRAHLAPTATYHDRGQRR
jgi:hypothetical protein